MGRWPLGKGSSRREVAVVESWLLQRGSSCKEVAICQEVDVIEVVTVDRCPL